MLRKLEYEHLNLSNIVMITVYLTCDSTIYAKIFSLVFFFFLSQLVTAVQPASLILFIAASFKEFPGDFWVPEIWRKCWSSYLNENYQGRFLLCPCIQCLNIIFKNHYTTPVMLPFWRCWVCCVEQNNWEWVHLQRSVKERKRSPNQLSGNLAQMIK